MTQPHIEGILGNYIEDADSVMCPTSISCPESCPSKHCWNNRLCQRFDSDHITAVSKYLFIVCNIDICCVLAMFDEVLKRFLCGQNYADGLFGSIRTHKNTLN